MGLLFLHLHLDCTIALHHGDDCVCSSKGWSRTDRVLKSHFFWRIIVDQLKQMPEGSGSHEPFLALLCYCYC